MRNLGEKIKNSYQLKISNLFQEQFNPSIILITVSLLDFLFDPVEDQGDPTIHSRQFLSYKWVPTVPYFNSRLMFTLSYQKKTSYIQLQKKWHRQLRIFWANAAYYIHCNNINVILTPCFQGRPPRHCPRYSYLPPGTRSTGWRGRCRGRVCCKFSYTCFLMWTCWIGLCELTRQQFVLRPDI